MHISRYLVANVASFKAKNKLFSLKNIFRKLVVVLLVFFVGQLPQIRV